MDYNFGYDSTGNGNDTIVEKTEEPKEDITNLDTGKKESEEQDINQNKDSDNPDDGKSKKDNNESKDDTDTSKEESLEEGSIITVDDKKYTVDSEGNLRDENGSIFKEASEVKAWMDNYSVDDSEDSISISAVQDALGVEITGEDGNPVEFENTVDGIKAYVNAVNETTKEEHMEAAINSLYSRYPIIKDVLDYYIANGNSLEGFNEVPDRSNITIDDNNEAQQEDVIRIAWQEQNRGGDVEPYIQYLKSSGLLCATAKKELAGLQEADRQYKEHLQNEANRIEEENIKSQQLYWNNIYDTIKSKKIGKYSIPDSIIVNRNGQKLSVTPDDFFAYIYNVDEEGKSMYQRDLEQEDKNDSINDTLIRAFLKFTGGDYSNLIDMAINDKKVNELKLKAKQRKSSSIRITKPKVVKGTDIDFGYN